MRAQKDAQGIYDFDALVVEPRLARVGGEVVDVSMIPVAVTLKLAAHSDRSKEEVAASVEADAQAEYMKLVQMVSDVCVASNPKLTPDFLLAHLDYAKMTEFAKFVLRPMTDKAEEFLEDEEGNATPDSPSS